MSVPPRHCIIHWPFAVLLFRLTARLQFIGFAFCSKRIETQVTRRTHRRLLEQPIKHAKAEAIATFGRYRTEMHITRMTKSGRYVCVER